MGSEQDLSRYGFWEDNATPYVRGNTPPYDLEDLNVRHPTETVGARSPDTILRSGELYSVDDLSDAFDFNKEVEKMLSGPGNVLAPPKLFNSIDSSEEEVSQDSPSKAATPPAPAVDSVQAGRDRSPPTPHWPGLSPFIDREPTPAAPHLSISPDYYGITTQVPTTVQAAFHEDLAPEAPDFTSLPNFFPSMDDTAALWTQDWDKAPDAASFSSSPEHFFKTPMATQLQTLSSPLPASFNVMTTPGNQDHLEESTGFSISPSASIGASSAKKYTVLPSYSPRVLKAPSSTVGTPRQRDQPKWINIAPASAHATKSSPIADSGGFVDNGVTASFQAPFHSSSSLRESQDTSPTGLTQMRQSRLRAKEAEEGQARMGKHETTTNLEEGAELMGHRSKYPEHPSFYPQGEFMYLPGNHRVASAFRGSSLEESQSTYPQYSSSTMYHGPAANTGAYLSPYASNNNDSRVMNVQPTYRNEARTMPTGHPGPTPPFNPTFNPNQHAISNPNSNQRPNPVFNPQNARGVYYRPSVRHEYPVLNTNSNQPFNRSYPSNSYPSNSYPWGVNTQNPTTSQMAAPPRLTHKSSSGDSLRVFPPTPAGAITPKRVPSSSDSANPSPNYLAGRALASTIQRPPSTPSSETGMMPKYPRFSPSTSALELQLPSQAAETATLAGTTSPAETSTPAETTTPAPDQPFLKRRPGRPRKIVDPNEPAPKRVRKRQTKPATAGETTATKETATATEEGEVREKRPRKRKAKATDEGEPTGESEKGKGKEQETGAEEGDGDEAAAKPKKRNRARAAPVVEESYEAKVARWHDMVAKSGWSLYDD